MSYEIPYDWKFNANFSDVKVIPGLATSSGSNTFSGDINSATVTDPTTNSSSTLSTTLADINTNVFRPGAKILVTDSSDSSITFGYSATAGSTPVTWSAVTLSPDNISIGSFTQTNTNSMDFEVSNASDTPGLSSEVNYGSNSSTITQDENGINFTYSLASSKASIDSYIMLIGGISLISQTKTANSEASNISNISLVDGNTTITSSGYLNITTQSLPTNYLTDSSVKIGNMIFDDTDGIMYRCTSTSTTSNVTTNTWDTYYSTSMKPISPGINYVKEADSIVIKYSTGGLSTDTAISTMIMGSTSYEIFNGKCTSNVTSNGFMSSGLKDGVSFTAGYGYTGINMSLVDSSNNSSLLTLTTSSTIIQSSTTSNNSSLVLSSTGLNYSTTGQVNITGGDQIIIDSSSDSGEIVFVAGSNIVFSTSSLYMQLQNIPTSPTTSTNNSNFSVGNGIVYSASETTWYAIFPDADWQIGITPTITSYTATTTSGTAGTTSVPVKSTSGYYLLNSRVIGKCSTSGMSIIHTLTDYALMYDGTTVTLSNGETSLHSFGNVTSPTVTISISGTDIVYTYNATTASSTTWTWSIVVEQKFVTTY